MPLAENAVYFFHFVALCLVWPYLPLFLSRYVSEAELGLLLGATRLVGVAPRRPGLAGREVRPRAHSLCLGSAGAVGAPGLGGEADAILALVLLARSASRRR